MVGDVYMKTIGTYRSTERSAVLSIVLCVCRISQTISHFDYIREDSVAYFLFALFMLIIWENREMSFLFDWTLKSVLNIYSMPYRLNNSKLNTNPVSIPVFTILIYT